MKTQLLDYSLPEERIAKRPPESRDAGKMLTLTQEGMVDGWVRQLIEQIEPGDLVVLNETKVRKARLDVYRPRHENGGGAKVELLLLGMLAQGTWEALGKANKAIQVGDIFELHDSRFTVVNKSDDGTLELKVEGDVEALLQDYGVMPIPPYLRRKSDESDNERYQTVFARELGSAAAPTAVARVLSEDEKVARVSVKTWIGQDVSERLFSLKVNDAGRWQVLSVQ